MSSSIERENPSDNPGLLDGAKKMGSELLEKLDSWSEAHGEAPWHRTARRLFLDVAFLALVCVAATVMVGGTLNPLHAFHAIALTLANPGFTTLMSMPILLAAGGVGVYCLLQDILPKKAHHAASQVMAVVFPFIVIGAAFSLMMAGGGTHVSQGIPSNFSLTRAMTSPYFFVGLLLLPMGFYATSSSLERLSQKHVPILEGRVPRTTRNIRNRHHTSEEVQRQTRQNHEHYNEINQY